MPTPTPTFIKKKPKPSTSYPLPSKPWNKKYGYGSKSPKKKVASATAALQPTSTNQGLNCRDGNFGTPGSFRDRDRLTTLSKSHTIICPPNAHPPFEEALPMRLPSTSGKPFLVLNPGYEGPGSPRFSVVHYPKVYTVAKVMTLYHCARNLTFSDTMPIKGSSRHALLGFSASGYTPTSSYEDLGAFQRGLSVNSSLLDVRMCNTDRSTREAMKAAIPQILSSLNDLASVGFRSRPFPEDCHVLDESFKALRAANASSVAVSWGGWDWTTFPNDHSKHYTFVIPLCSGTMGLGDLGTLQFEPGDVIALLAGRVPHFLRSPEGKEGYVITCWTEDRAMRLIEYDAWLRAGR